jgi:serine-type D-Ala-D-Ala carboxypeptidase (penicillin-binding protein 5/6)
LIKKLLIFLVTISFSITINQFISVTNNIDNNLNFNSSVESSTQNIFDLTETSNPQRTIISANILADIAIMMHYNTGEIIFEKNADKFWPSASLSKLFLIYFALEEFEKRGISLDDYIEVTNNYWEQDLVPFASRMFLEKNQRITFRKLLEGISIVSGNDGAFFLVNYLFGNKDNFAHLVNSFISEKGLNQLHIEEPSGLSPYNRITARDFVKFVDHYIEKQYFLLDSLHSIDEFVYPTEENMVYSNNNYKFETTTRNNTNILLQKYPWAKGLKTGYTSLSGFNLVAIAEKDKELLIIVLLGGEGENITQGRLTIANDAITLFEKGFRILEND